jgi:hypothetical protein
MAREEFIVLPLANVYRYTQAAERAGAGGLIGVEVVHIICSLHEPSQPQGEES